MKDEEMAEEYLDEKCRDCYMCSYSEHKDPYKICQRRKDRKQAFLAGLKAGRPQWHDLRKDKNDLPKLDKTDMSDYVITDKGVAYYNGRVKSWYIQNEYILSDDVIAWCEIPTFDKE